MRVCDSCGDGLAYAAEEKCPESKAVCGHHCNHSWSHDACCWCGKVWGEVVDEPCGIVNSVYGYTCDRQVGHEGAHVQDRGNVVVGWPATAGRGGS